MGMRQDAVDVMIATRIHAPEAAAAAFRLNAVENAAIVAGYRTHVLTTCDAREQTPADDRRSPLLRISRWPVLRDASGYVRGYLPYMSFDLPLFARLLFAPRPRVLLVEPPPTTGLVARAATTLRSLGGKRFPYVWYAADIWSDATAIAGAHPLVTALVRRMERCTITGAAATIAVSEGVARRVRELAPDARVRVIPNGIDTDIFTPEASPLTAVEREELGITGPFFLYAGTASEWQGAEIFAHAIARVRERYPHAQLIFLGQGSSWETITQIKKQIMTFESRQGRVATNAPVIQLPPAPPEHATRFHVSALAALVSIIPGRGYDFAYPTKILSALASGIPALYAGVGPAAEDIRAYRLGWAVDYEVSAIAAAMCEALETTADAAWADSRRAHLRQWVCAHRSMAATGRQVVDLLDSVMLQPPGS